MGPGERTAPALLTYFTDADVSTCQITFSYLRSQPGPTGPSSPAPSPLSVPGGGGDAEFSFVPSGRWPGCALTVDQKYPLAFFFLTFSWVPVYGSDEAGEGTCVTWTGRQCMGIGHRFSACGSLGGGAGGQSGPTARSQHEPMRAAQHPQPLAPRGCPDSILCSGVPECFCNCSLIPCLSSFCSFP